MSLKLRIQVRDGQTVSTSNTTEELLAVLLDRMQGSVLLDNDDEETLRGWLLVRADQLENGQMVTLGENQSICIGKSADGRAFVRDGRGEVAAIKTRFRRAAI